MRKKPIPDINNNAIFTEYWCVVFMSEKWQNQNSD